MDNFFNYITKPLNPEDVDKWFRGNNIINEKLELYSDFSHSLYQLIIKTYLGHDNTNDETKISLTESDNTNHFEWCWNKTIDNFSKESIRFNKKGEHHEYFKSFFDEIFYKQKEIKIRESIEDFFNDLFNIEKPFTKSDLDMISSIYKALDKNLNM
jgi:hypothetical protein